MRIKLMLAVLFIIAIVGVYQLNDKKNAESKTMVIENKKPANSDQQDKHRQLGVVSSAETTAPSSNIKGSTEKMPSVRQMMGNMPDNIYYQAVARGYFRDYEENDPYVNEHNIAFLEDMAKSGDTFAQLSLISLLDPTFKKFSDKVLNNPDDYADDMVISIKNKKQLNSQVEQLSDKALAEKYENALVIAAAYGLTVYLASTDKLASYEGFQAMAISKYAALLDGDAFQHFHDPIEGDFYSHLSKEEMAEVKQQGKILYDKIVKMRTELGITADKIVSADNAKEMASSIPCWRNPALRVTDEACK